MCCFIYFDQIYFESFSGQTSKLWLVSEQSDIQLIRSLVGGKKREEEEKRAS